MKVSVVPDSSTPVEPSDSTMVNPGTSSSVVVTLTVWSPTAPKVASDAASTTATVIFETCEPSMIPASSIPVVVIVCGVSQFAGVNVTESRSTVASLVLEDSIDRTTLVLGSAVRTIVKVSVVPDSSTSVEPLDSTMVNPASSSSAVVAKTCHL